MALIATSPMLVPPVFTLVEVTNFFDTTSVYPEYDEKAERPRLGLFGLKAILVYLLC
jgi:hypothetical protein